MVSTSKAVVGSTDKTLGDTISRLVRNDDVGVDNGGRRSDVVCLDDWVRLSDVVCLDDGVRLSDVVCLDDAARLSDEDTSTSPEDTSCEGATGEGEGASDDGDTPADDTGRTEGKRNTSNETTSSPHNLYTLDKQQHTQQGGVRRGGI